MATSLTQRIRNVLMIRPTLADASARRWPPALQLAGASLHPVSGFRVGDRTPYITRCPQKKKVSDWKWHLRNPSHRISEKCNVPS